MHPHRCIDHQYADLGPFDRPFGPQRRIEFKVIFYFSASS
jgi:hypothetical protein